MQYRKEIRLRDGHQCLLRSASASDAEEILVNFNKTHGQIGIYKLDCAYVDLKIKPEVFAFQADTSGLFLIDIQSAGFLNPTHRSINQYP